MPKVMPAQSAWFYIEEVLAARWAQITDPAAASTSAAGESSVDDNIHAFFYEWLDKVYVLPETVVLAGAYTRPLRIHPDSPTL